MHRCTPQWLVFVNIEPAAAVTGVHRCQQTGMDASGSGQLWKDHGAGAETGIYCEKNPLVI